MLKYTTLVLGELQTNCYIVWEDKSKEAIIIDPADAGIEIGDEIIRLGLKPLSVVGTHGHFDHMLGALDLMLTFKLPLAISSLDKFLLNRQQESATHFLKHKVKTPNIININIDLNKAVAINIGKERLIIIKTPGHTPGGICLYSESNKILFSGDVLFAEGSIGDTNHKYSSMIELRNSIRTLYSLPKDTIILPGHGEADTIENCRKLGGLE